MSETLLEYEERERCERANRLLLKYGLPLCGIITFLFRLSVVSPFIGYARVNGFAWERTIKIQDSRGYVTTISTSGMGKEPYYEDYILNDSDIVVSQTEIYYLDTLSGLSAGALNRFTVDACVWGKAEEGSMFFYCFGWCTIA